MPCDNCNSLNRKLSATEPHPDLEMDGAVEYRGEGFRKAISEKFHCGACGQHFTRDMDDHDPGACWEFARG